jgi:phosphorylase superfamily protein
MPANVLKSGQFAGIKANDTFALAALRQSPIIYHLGSVPWPTNLQPTSLPLGKYAPGTKITSAVSVNADVLVVLYTDQETMAVLDVLTGNPDWSAKTQSDWCEYGHNFNKFKPLIANVHANNVLADGAFGRLSEMKIAGKTVVLYKSELHPKQDGTGLPFVPVMQQMIGELAPKYVITTGTAGAIGDRIKCGDVTICTSSRLHVQKKYPAFPAIDTLSEDETVLTNAATFDPQYVQYAATHFTKLSLPGLEQCYTRLQSNPGYSFVPQNTLPPAVYATGVNPVPGPQPMDIVSADYMTTDDNNNSEKLQTLGIMNDTDDAFLFYAISKMQPAKRPKCISVRNASEPQMVHSPFPATTTPTEIVNILKDMAGTVYGIYQYCTTLNSAFACWGVIAGLP